MKRTFDAQLKLNEKLVGVFDLFVDKNYKIESLQQSLAFFSFAVCHKNHKAIILLSKNGFGQDALKLARTLYEVRLTLKYILIKETDETIERYFRRTFITQERLYNTITHSNAEFKKILEERIAENRPGDIDISELKKLASEAKDTHPGIEKSHWTGKQIEEMAKAIGEQAIYDMQYRLASNYIHFDPIIAKDYIKDVSDTFLLFDDPQKWQIESLMMAYFYSQEIIQLCENVGLFKLGDTVKSLNQAYENFDDVDTTRLK